MNCPDASVPIWTAAKEREFRAKVALAPLGDTEIEVSVVEARLGKLLTLLELVPPHPVTENAFRLVRIECLGFHEDMMWLRKNADFKNAGVSGETVESGVGKNSALMTRAGKPSRANPARVRAVASETEFPSSPRCFESPRPSGRVNGGPEGTSSLKTAFSPAVAGGASENGVPILGCLENSDTVDSRPPFLALRFYMTYIVLSYRYAAGDQVVWGL
jgi:hypothetical protein